MTKYFKVLVLTLFIGNLSYSQNITLKVIGIKDTTVNLIKYVGNKLYYADTAELKGGKVTFDGSKQEPGIMGLLLPGQKYFEFVFNKEEVNIEVKSPNYVETMVINKSNENKIFLSYMKYIKEQREKADQLREGQKEITDEAKKKEIDEQIRKIGDDVLAYQEKVVKENPTTLVSKIISMSSDIKIPEAPLKEDGTKDENFGYFYMRDHYFDNIDLTDDRLVNTPILQNKLEYYYSKNMLLQHPDTLIKYIKPVMDKIPEGSMMYRFFVTNITSAFEKSKIMGMDKVMNFMIWNYYCSLDKNGNYKGYWMEQDKLEDLCKDTKFRIRLMIGEVPPNIILPDSTNQKWYNLYKEEADYTILYFWDPDCGHCKKVTPQLQKLYAQKLQGRNVKVFAVGKATGDDFEHWKKFIKKEGLTFINVGVTRDLYNKAKEDPYSVIPSKTTLESINYQETYDIYSTPRMWVLDKDKKIIAKSLSIAQVERFLDELQGHKDDPKIFDLEETEDIK
ncbi:MAG: redoxin domain-containing protein [Brumimicrobium sp.]|nr:redoxin domain-containing protein [Brumimicrobium sp.]